MAIASLAAAKTQFADNLSGYWTSASQAKALLEAIDYLIGLGNATMSAGDSSLEKFDLVKLREKVAPIALALNPSAARTAMFSRVRIGGLGSV